MSTLELFPTDDAVDAIPRPPEALDTSNTNNEKLFDSDAVLAQLFSMGFPIEASAEVVEQVGKRAVEAGGRLYCFVSKRADCSILLIKINLILYFRYFNGYDCQCLLEYSHWLIKQQSANANTHHSEIHSEKP